MGPLDDFGTQGYLKVPEASFGLPVEEDLVREGAVLFSFDFQKDMSNLLL